MAEDDAREIAEKFHQMEVEYDRSEARRLADFADRHHLTFEVDRQYHCVCGAGPFTAPGYTLHVLAEWHTPL